MTTSARNSWTVTAPHMEQNGLSWAYAVEQLPQTLLYGKGQTVQGEQLRNERVCQDAGLKHFLSAG